MTSTANANNSFVSLAYFQDLLAKTTLEKLTQDVKEYLTDFINADGSCLISEAAAMVIIAKDVYDIDLAKYAPEQEMKLKTYTVHELTSDLEGQVISLKGKVLEIYPTKEFTRKTDGKPGKLTSMKLGDLKTEAITYVKFWNKTKEFVEQHYTTDDKLRFDNVRTDLYKEYINVTCIRQIIISHLEDVKT